MNSQRRSETARRRSIGTSEGLWQRLKGLPLIHYVDLAAKVPSNVIITIISVTIIIIITTLIIITIILMIMIMRMIMIMIMITAIMMTIIIFKTLFSSW